MGFSQLLPIARHGWAELAGPSSQKEPMLGAELGMEGTGEAERTRATARTRARGNGGEGEGGGLFPCHRPRTVSSLKVGCHYPTHHGPRAALYPSRDMQQQEHPTLVLTPLWLHQARKTPRAVQQVARRQRCPMVPARLAAQPSSPGQGSQVPSGSSHPPSPTECPIPCNTQPACPAGMVEDALSWHRVIRNPNAQGNSSRHSMSGEPLASPCSIQTFADQVAP